MIQDKYGFAHQAGRRGIAEFEAATHAVLTYAPNAADLLTKAVEADPAHTAAHALNGLALVIQARADLLGRARACRTAAHAALDGTPTPDERSLLGALDLALAGLLADAADRLDTPAVGFAVSPLKTKLANMLRFMLGDPKGMARGTAAALAALPPGAPGHSQVLGCHAFALEELGDYAAAEFLGRRALAEDPNDAWTIHAIAHTFEMRGMARDGAAWMEARRPVWREAGGFGFHAAWHQALFHLELGQYDRVLALYDTDIRPRPTLDTRDIANGVGMLWRLRQLGLAVGGRWDELAGIARQRVDDTSVLFFTLHNLMALLAVGDEPAAAAMVDAIDREALGVTDQAHVARTIGAPLAHVLVDLARQQGGGARLDELAVRLRPLGGSVAQRDLFVRALAEGALACGDAVSCAAIVTARRAMRPADRFDSLMQDAMSRPCVAA